LGQPALEVAAGGSHTCALLADGRVRCWGAGTLGIGTPDTSPSPGVYVDLGGRATHITTGGDHSCAILTTRKLRCWGVNYNTGYGYEIPLAPPSAYGDVPLGADVVQVSAGEFHTCAVLVNGRVRCWGVNSSGQSGYPGIDGLREAASAADVLVAFGPAQALSSRD
jgi:alpha-tubulin suppressor-like RCC1 family protein